MNSTSGFQSFALQLRAFIARCMRNCPQGTDAELTFNRLALELFRLQFLHNDPYQAFCSARGVSPKTVSHSTEIPAISTASFKEVELSCLDTDARTAVFHSSGTTGHRPSRHFHSRASLEVYEGSLLPWFQHCFLPEIKSLVDKPAAGIRTFLILTPSLLDAPRSSLVHMFETIRRQWGSKLSGFIGSVGGDGGWRLDLGIALDRLQRAAERNEPVALLGTAFSFVQLLDGLANRNQGFKLAPGSRVLETGGYKGRSRALPKTELYALIAARLGISSDHIVSEYGMSELSSQAYDRKVADGPGPVSRTFRFPPWVRTQIISPETEQEVRDGETGLLRILDLANVYSVMAVQTEDLATRRGAAFEVVGRLDRAEARGCSLMAV